MDARSCGPRAGVCSERLGLNMDGWIPSGWTSDFGLGTSARNEKVRDRPPRFPRKVRAIGGSEAECASVNVNRVNVNRGRSYVGSDSPRVAASTPGSPYPFSMHGVSRGGICMYVCMYVWRQSPGPGALPWGKCGLARAWAVRGNVHVTLVGREA